MQKINKGQVARSVRFDIGTDKNEEFHTIFRNDVLPILKKQDGFRNELLFLDDQHVLARQFDNRILVQLRLVFHGLVGDHGRHSNAQKPIWL